MNKPTLLRAAISVLTLAALGAWVGYRIAPESAPVARGGDYAAMRGCIACHGDPQDPSADRGKSRCADEFKQEWHPAYEAECTDVMAYFEAVRLHRNIDARSESPANPLIAGERLARKYHCFQCHGYLGQGGFRNSGSLKGYVPGYFGSDFKLLTGNADPDSVRAWILHGLDRSILEAPVTGRVAEYFINRQAVNMPSFGSIDPEEVDVLVRYVITLHEYGPMTAETIRWYSERSRADPAAL